MSDGYSLPLPRPTYRLDVACDLGYAALPDSLRRNSRRLADLGLAERKFQELIRVLRLKQSQGQRTPLRSQIVKELTDLHPEFFSVVGSPGWKEYSQEAEERGIIKLHPVISGKGGRGPTVELLLDPIIGKEPAQDQKYEQEVSCDSPRSDSWSYGRNDAREAHPVERHYQHKSNGSSSVRSAQEKSRRSAVNALILSALRTGEASRAPARIPSAPAWLRADTPPSPPTVPPPPPPPPLPLSTRARFFASAMEPKAPTPTLAPKLSAESARSFYPPPDTLGTALPWIATCMDPPHLPTPQPSPSLPLTAVVAPPVSATSDSAPCPKTSAFQQFEDPTPLHVRLNQQLRTIGVTIPSSSPSSASPPTLSLSDIALFIPSSLSPDTAKISSSTFNQILLGYADYDRSIAALRALSKHGEAVKVELTAQWWSGSEEWRWCDVLLESEWGQRERDAGEAEERTRKRAAEEGRAEEEAKRSRVDA